MTSLDLLSSLKEFIEKTVKDYSLETKAKQLREPKVHEGYLPPKDSGNADESEFPFVIIRLLEDESSLEEGKVKIKLLTGTYSYDSDGWKDAVNIMNRIKLKLFEKRILDKKFRIEYPFKIVLPEEQPYPQWMCEAVSTWIIPRPVEILEEKESDVYGY